LQYYHVHHGPLSEKEVAERNATANLLGDNPLAKPRARAYNYHIRIA